MDKYFLFGEPPGGQMRPASAETSPPKLGDFTAAGAPREKMEKLCFATFFYSLFLCFSLFLLCFSMFFLVVFMIFLAFSMFFIFFLVCYLFFLVFSRFFLKLEGGRRQ